MKDTVLYEQLLGLGDPWSVKRVELSIEDNRVTVEVELERGIVWVDPEVEGARAHIHGWTERQWRHLVTCQFETIIKARVPQLKYRHSNVPESNCFGYQTPTVARIQPTHPLFDRQFAHDGIVPMWIYLAIACCGCAWVTGIATQ